MLAPGGPDRIGPASHRTRVLLGAGLGDIGDRDLASGPWDGGLFNVTRTREPALDALVHLLRAAVLDRDRETGEVRRERAAGHDVAVVLARVAINSETTHRLVARVLERAKTEVIEELLARLAAADRRAALGTRLAGDSGLLVERVRELHEIGYFSVR